MPSHSTAPPVTTCPKVFGGRNRRGAVGRLSWFLLALACGCDASKAEYETLRAETDRLRRELDECQNGPDRLAAVAKRAYADGKLKEARETIELLRSRHPESSRNTEVGALIPEIDRRLGEESRRAEVAAQEQLRLREFGDTGIWVLDHFVDKFSSATETAYIRNKQPIRGRFSNTATNGANLTVVFIISGPDQIAIQLFEYGGSNPVKVSSPEGYSVAVKTSDGEELKATALNFSDRLVLYEDGASPLHNALMAGGRIQFAIQGNTAQYQFAVDQADGYRNAFRLLSESLEPPAAVSKPGGESPRSRSRGPS